MTWVRLYHDDCKARMRRLRDEGVRVHSVVSDPPYGLVSIQKRFGNGQAAASARGNDGSFGRLSRGFMNRTWDGTAIELDVEMWRLAYDLLLPGGYLLAFASPRTGHRMACAIEDAGFIMHPMIGWAYASGFPKAHAADKAIDRELGDRGGSIDGRYFPVAAEAAAWSGWAYGAQARKPALEPIYVAQKPFSERNGALNILKHGVGAVNIDGCRVPLTAIDASQNRKMARNQRSEDLSGHAWGMSKRGSEIVNVVRTDGRYPPNLMHDGSPEVVAQFPYSAGQIGPTSTDLARAKTRHIYNLMGRSDVATAPRGDRGSAARFFPEHRLSMVDERNIIGTSCDYVPTSEDVNHDGSTEQMDAMVDDRATSSRELIEFSPFESKTVFFHRKAGKEDRRFSDHPTIKPQGLIQDLVRHVTPIGGTVLDPFGGSGTTAAAALLEGVNCIIIERENEYVANIERRLGMNTPALDYLKSLGF